MLSLQVKSQERPILDIMLTNYEYPFNVDYFHFNSQKQDFKMVAPYFIGTRDRTAIGKNKVKDESIREKMGLYQFLGKKT